MRLILVTGGVRSGKSAYAQQRARALGGDAVTIIVTAVPGDAEMARRIARHRAERPAAWHTIDAPTNTGAALRTVETEVVLLDCLSILASNALLGAEPTDEEPALEAVASEIDQLIAAAAERSGTLIVVTNEVGLGVVPATPLGRWYRDALGMANQRLASAADEVVLLLSGLAVPLKIPDHAQAARG